MNKLYCIFLVNRLELIYPFPPPFPSIFHADGSFKGQKYVNLKHKKRPEDNKFF